MTANNFKNQPSERHKIHYAWVVCFGCVLMFFCTCGLSCNVFSIYSPFIMEARGFTKTQMSVIISTRSLFQTVAVFLTGRFYKRLNLRQGMLIAGLTCALGYVVYGLAESFPVYLIGSAVVGLGYGLGSMVPISMLLEQWFVRDRTLAVSLVSAASGMATIGVPTLITAAIERFSMKTAFLGEAFAMVILILVSWLIIRNNPGELSIAAFGEKEKKKSRAIQEAAAAKDNGPCGTADSRDGVDSRDGADGRERTAGRRELSRAWWFLLYIMVILSTSFNCAGFSHLSLLCSTEGFDSGIVALALSVSGGMLMIGKFVFGILSSRISLYRTSMIYGIGCIAATFLCCLIRLGTWFMFFAVGLFGFMLTLISVGLVAWLSDWASQEERADRIRIFQLLYSFGALIMGLVPGILADASGGSYVPFYFISGCMCVIVVILIWLTYRKLGFTEKGAAR